MPSQSLRETKRRILNVDKTRQITRAMEMVAASKLRRAGEKALRLRPFAGKLSAVLARLLATQDQDGNLGGAGRSSKGGPAIFVAITADRGLAGGYNANVIRLAEEKATDAGQEAGIITIGRKARDYFSRAGWDIQAEWVNLGDDIELWHARDIARTLTGFYQRGIFGEVHLVYNFFVNAASQVPRVRQLFPIESEAITKAVPGEIRSASAPYIYEPSPAAVLEGMVSYYAEVTVYQTLLEAKASEHAARQKAMHNATENAESMIDELTLSFNRARQSAITTEILDIVGGAEALEKRR